MKFNSFPLASRCIPARSRWGSPPLPRQKKSLRTQRRWWRATTTFGWQSQPRKQEPWSCCGAAVATVSRRLLVLGRREASSACRYVSEINDTLAKDPNKYVQFIKHLQYNLLPPEFIAADEREHECTQVELKLPIRQGLVFFARPMQHRHPLSTCRAAVWLCGRRHGKEMEFNLIV